MAYHARLGPSSAHRWRNCTASPNASDGLPNDGNDASRMGTACHEVSSECLSKNLDPSDFVGEKFLFCKNKVTGRRVENFAALIVPSDELVVEHTVVIEEGWAEYVRSYVDFVREMVATTGGTLLVEQRVPIGQITGEGYWRDPVTGDEVDEGTPGAVWCTAGGTSDAIILTDETIITCDAKFGRNKVVAYEVVQPSRPDPITGDMSAPLYAPNDQLAMYAAGALEEHGLFADFKFVKMLIVQPPLNHVSEFTMTVEALAAHIAQVKLDAEATRTNPTFNAGDHCTYCPARITCKPRDQAVITMALEGFDDINDPVQIAAATPKQQTVTMLGALYDKIPMIQAWCKDKAAQLEAAVAAGEHVVNSQGIGFKFVAGPKGDRTWDDPEAIETILKKSMRLRDDQMYTQKLISPPQAEKLAKKKRGKDAQPPLIGERQWNTLSSHIKQADGRPQLVLETDPRDALPSALDGFDETSSQPTTDEVDLFN